MATISTSPAKTRCATGFSLVEMILVLLIVGLLAALAAPSLSRRRPSPYRDACELALLLGQARRAALHGGVEVTVEFYDESGILRVRSMTADQTERTDIPLGPCDYLSSTTAVGSSPVSKRIVFTPDGVDDPHWLRFNGPESMIVEVDAPSGMAQVLDADQFDSRRRLLAAVDDFWQARYAHAGSKP